MSSLVACIGFTDPSALAAIVRESGQPYHELSSTMKWQDSSGAMLLLDRTATYARAGFATQVRTPYTELAAGSTGLAQITLIDMYGQPIDRFTVVPDARYTVGWSPTGRTALVALSIDTEFFATAEDFYDSPRSALNGFDQEPPPPEVKQFGLPWPPTMEIESFMPSENPNDAVATMSGTVQFAEVHTNSNTGHEFLVARIATMCGEIDLCTPLPLDGVPAPGSVVVGQVELHAAFPAHGSEDVAEYTAPSEKVEPTFRAGEPSEEDFEPEDEEDDELPDGLVLGEDGIVRTEEEHRTWKIEGDPVDDEPEAEPEAPSDAPVGASEEEPLGDAAAQAAQPDAPRPDTAQAAQPAAHASDDDESAPRPGETRREWRQRTGR